MYMCMCIFLHMSMCVHGLLRDVCACIHVCVCIQSAVRSGE